MSDQQTAATDRELSTADLASAVPEQDVPDQESREDLAGEDVREEPRETTREGVSDEAAPVLFDEEKVTGYRDRWQVVQTGFVDDPHRAVREADELVAAVISALAATFAEHKSELEAQWQQGEPATEELRVALRRYRAFFDELLPH